MTTFNIDYCEHPLDMDLLSPYKNLLYCRLALPEVPKIDQQALEKYVHETNELLATNLIERPLDRGGSDRFAKQANVHYPWKTAWVRSRMYDGWFNKFDEKFPELTNYLLEFPIDSLEEIAVAQLLVQKENVEAFPHTDPDPYFGFRIYLTNEPDRANLYFYPSYTDLEERPTTFVTSNGVTTKNDLTKFYNFNDKFIVKNNKGKFPFMLNSVRGCHGVEKNAKPECDRIVLSVFFKKINSSKLADLFSRSVVKYKDSCIWR
jgi:hypothetical protein